MAKDLFGADLAKSIPVNVHNHVLSELLLNRGSQLILQHYEAACLTLNAIAADIKQYNPGFVHHTLPDPNVIVLLQQFINSGDVVTPYSHWVAAGRTIDLYRTVLEKFKAPPPPTYSYAPFGVSSFSIGIPNKFPTDSYLSVLTNLPVVATSQLWTFPEPGASLDLIYTTLAKLATLNGGKKVFHEIHVFNGPGHRGSKDYWINNIMGRPVSHKEFVTLINSNATVQSKVREVLTDVVAFANRLKSAGIEVVICPELEDNHSSPATYMIYLSILEALGWSRGNIVRCGGSIGDIPGIRYESHINSVSGLKSSGLRPGDIYNMDGKTYRYNSDPSESNVFSENEVRDMLRFCKSKGIIMFIWGAELQGLKHKKGGQPWDMEVVGQYANRTYVLRKPLELKAILEDNLK